MGPDEVRITLLGLAVLDVSGVNGRILNETLKSKAYNYASFTHSAYLYHLCLVSGNHSDSARELRILYVSEVPIENVDGWMGRYFCGIPKIVVESPMG